MTWFATARQELTPVIEYMRGRDQPDRRDASAPNDPGGAHRQSAIIRRLMGRPAVVAAVAVGSGEIIPASADRAAPIIMSVKFIDDRALSGIAAQLRLTNLRRVEQKCLRSVISPTISTAGRQRHRSFRLDPETAGR